MNTPLADQGEEGRGRGSWCWQICLSVCLYSYLSAGGRQVGSVAESNQLEGYYVAQLRHTRGHVNMGVSVCVVPFLAFCGNLNWLDPPPASPSQGRGGGQSVS